MAAGIHRLAEGRLLRLPTGIHSDGGGLYLKVKKSGARAWVYIYQWEGKRREKGLGALRDVPIDEARKKAAEAREMRTQGVDPLRPVVEPGQGVTFGMAAEELLTELEHGWKNPKHRQQWRNTLTDYCRPMWEKPIADLDTNDVVAVLSPIWLQVPETASRLRGRIERVLDAAKVKGHRKGENPARWKGHLKIILPEGRKKSATKHHASMPYQDVPAFIPKLRRRISTAAKSLEFMIYTACRTGEVLGARWLEVDLEQKVWTVPADRMKTGLEHRVPLSAPAIVILNGMMMFGSEPEDFIFPGQKDGHSLANTAMLMLLRRMGADDCTPHGFRSSFRDWCGEETDYPREIAEAALAHQVGSEVERAYRRGDALAKRRKLMDAWAEYLLGTPQAQPPRPQSAASVLPQPRRRKPKDNPLQVKLFED